MDKVSQAVIQVVCGEFLPFLSEKLSLDVEELNTAWQEFNGKPSVIVTQVVRERSPKKDRRVSPGTKYSQDSLEKMKIKDLKPICETLGLVKSGVKTQIIERILVKLGIEQIAIETRKIEMRKSSASSSSSTSVRSITKIDIAREEKKKSRIIDFEKLRAPDVKITKNELGHWIHEETRIVFTEEEEYIEGVRCRVAIGFEDNDEKVEDLGEEQIDLCNQYGFRYREPENIII